MQAFHHSVSVNRLTILAFLVHGADQLALAALPLTAVILFAAPPGAIGMLVAAHSAAWLLVSLPMGVIIDRMPLRYSLRSALSLCVTGAVLAGFATAMQSLAGLALASFTLASGTVIFVMAQITILPTIVPRAKLTASNANIETARAFAMLTAPVIAGWCIATISANAVYGLATFAALSGLTLTFFITLMDTEKIVARTSVLSSIVEGARFVVRNDTLRAIALCAIFWNIAFFGLIASFVPFALKHIGLSTASAGFALGLNGVGLLLGALLAAPIIRAVGPSIILVAGPAVSFLGALCIFASPAGHGLALAAFGFFLIGFGPMLWLIVQTSIRQLITPPHLLARVTATIQMAIYGARPLGALTAGLIGETYGLLPALVFCMSGFAASVAVAGLSPLSRMKRMPEVAI